MKQPLNLFLIFIILLTGSCQKKSSDEPTPEVVQQIGYSIESVLPHDTNSFTEGLLFMRDTLFESTGSPPGLPECRSLFGPLMPETGRIIIKADLTNEGYFGEGIACLNNRFYQLTYLDEIGFIYDAVTFCRISQFRFPAKEGWGLTTDGVSLIMSDGTDKITFFDPENFQITKSISVTRAGIPRTGINEMEYSEGFIYANYWLGTKVLKIDPTNGKVVAEIDLNELLIRAQNKFPGSSSMNGIAVDPGNNHLFITGKRWPEIYEISLTDPGL